MGDPTKWCYSLYEMPPRGVSEVNPAGHLMMALRNKGEKTNLSQVFTRLQSVAGFFRTSGQSLLMGILSILPWQLMFVPCINTETDWSDANIIRHNVMQALRRVDPEFQRPWAVGMPGTIPFARIEYILVVDRHSRVYKFDPIKMRWLSTADGIKPAVPSLFKGSFTDLTHTPRRLLIFTTDFELYGFRLCIPNVNSPNCGALTLGTSERQLKLFVKSFVNNLATHVAHVRSSTGMELALEYAKSHPQALPYVDPSSQQHYSSSNLPHSIDPFDLLKQVWSPANEDCYRPVNRNPVHPVYRLRQNWASFKMDDCIWLENTQFSFCRTYPLHVPTVPMKQSLFGLRTFFEGNRFPMLSYVHANRQDTGTKVSLLRCGRSHSSLDLRRIIKCDTAQCTLRMSPKCLVLIRLNETSTDKSMEFFEFNLLSSKGSVSLPLTDPFPNCSNSHSCMFAPCEDLFSNFTPTLHRNLSVNYIPSSESKGSSIRFRASQTEITWPTPLMESVHRSWLKLGSLVRVPQIHIPPGEKISHGSFTSFQKLNLSYSQSSLNALDESVQYSQESPLPSRSFDRFTLTPDVPRRMRSNTGTSTTSFRFSRPSESSCYDTDETPAFLTVPHGRLKRGVPLQRNISSVAAVYSPHRSSWNDRFSSTQWFALITLCLNQAMRLAGVIRHLNSCSRIPGSCSLVVLSGPGSGRIWQPIISSLAQIVLSPQSRTIAGFEDLIEREWVRSGYPFAPDPHDWHDSSVSPDYDGGASFALFIDSVYQLLFQFPVDFEFTEDYLVLLLDTALSRGGGLPPFAIEFSCSCDAARCVNNKSISSKEVEQQSDELFRRGALRCFRQWTNVLTPRGLELLPNWLYWWYWHPNPSVIKYGIGGTTRLSTNFPRPFHSMSELFLTGPPTLYIRCWVYGWFRWNRSLRLASGGGYAFQSAIRRKLLGPPELDDTNDQQQTYNRVRTSASPYTGWMSDEAIEISESLLDERLLELLNSDLLAPLLRLARDWEFLPDLVSLP